MVITRRAWALRHAPTLLSAALLIAPHATLASWLWVSGRGSALPGFVLAMALIWIVTAAIARNWRRFVLCQLPLFLLGIGFAAYTLSFRSPPGYVFAAVLATSSAADYMGFFSIWAGQRLLLVGVILAALYLWRQGEYPQRGFHRRSRVRCGRRSWLPSAASAFLRPRMPTRSWTAWR